MCEASAFMVKDNQEEMILESVDSFDCDGDQVRLINIFGEEKRLKARIKCLSLVEHKIILEAL
jgi:predicted RNA-binding protein